MGEASTTILKSMTRQVFLEAGLQQVPADFNFKNASPNFKRMVYKKTLEEIIRIFVENKDYQQLPSTSISAIKDGLIDTSEGFFELLESRITEDVKKEIEMVHPFLIEALSFAYEATTVLEGQGKRNEYYRALIKCCQQMSNVKLLLKAWKEPKNTT